MLQRLAVLSALVAAGCVSAPAADIAPALKGKSYIVQLSSSQYSSGYGDYLLPPLTRALRASGLRAQNGPGADLVVNIEPRSDVGRWVTRAGQRQWLYTSEVTVGISPERYDIPHDGKPQFGVTARLLTPDADRQDEFSCLIELAAGSALARYQPTGIIVVDGSRCAR